MEEGEFFAIETFGSTGKNSLQLEEVIVIYYELLLLTPRFICVLSRERVC